MCFVIFVKTFSEMFCYSKKILARFCDVCIEVFMYDISQPFQILMKLDFFFWQIFEKILIYEIC